jgi:predicted nucleic acid-binding protein
MRSLAPIADTNVLGELVRQRPNAGVLRWAETVSTMALSVVTVEEVFFGLAWRPNHRIRAWFEGFLADRCEILPVTVEIARRSGELRGGLQKDGSTHHQADMLIAATAEIHQRTLVTRNLTDFAGIPVTLLNPFS